MRIWYSLDGGLLYRIRRKKVETWCQDSWLDSLTYIHVEKFKNDCKLCKVVPLI